MTVGKEPDRDEVDHLIQGLMTGRQRKKDLPTADMLVGFRRPQPRRASRWTSARLQMPSWPRPNFGKALALGSAVSTPLLPDISGAIKLPGRVAMVRMWTALGLAYGLALSSWPYPKAYLWGLVLYLLSLALGLVAGVWGARISWDARLGGAHTIALASVVWMLWLGVVGLVPLLSGVSPGF